LAATEGGMRVPAVVRFDHPVLVCAEVLLYVGHMKSIFRDKDAFKVRSDGPEDQLQDYTNKYTFAGGNLT
jgi:hypothetical protein